MQAIADWREKHLPSLRFLPLAEDLFDAMPDVVFFVKDLRARYVAVSRTIVQRCGFSGKHELIGKTSMDIYPPPFGRNYFEQDQRLLRDGAALRNVLELHRYAQGGPGWCVTTKLPLRDDAGTVIGLVGVSKDIHMPAARSRGYRELAKAIRHIQTRYGDRLRVEALASMCGLSVYRFEERMKRIFLLTAGQFISKTRIDAARGMLRATDKTVARIAVECGFSDQSAFARQFKTATGLTPVGYRKRPHA